MLKLKFMDDDPKEDVLFNLSNDDFIHDFIKKEKKEVEMDFVQDILKQIDKSANKQC